MKLYSRLLITACAVAAGGAAAATPMHAEEISRATERYEQPAAPSRPGMARVHMLREHNHELPVGSVSDSNSTSSGRYTSGKGAAAAVSAPTSVPEPATVGLMGLGLLLVVFARRLNVRGSGAPTRANLFRRD